MDLESQTNLMLIFSISLWALSVLVGLIVTYWIIRLAVTHALRSHHHWMLKQHR